MTHPTPSTMARLAYPDEPTMTARERAEASEARSHYAAGAAAERTRNAAATLTETEARRALERITRVTCRDNRDLLASLSCATHALLNVPMADEETARAHEWLAAACALYLIRAAHHVTPPTTEAR